MSKETPLLRLENLKTVFRSRYGLVEAVSDVSFEVNRGQTVALVGESGSGKSVTVLSIMRLLENTGKIADGKIIFDGENLVEKTEEEMRHIRGNDIAMVFQDPMTCLDPVYTIGNQIMEVLHIHEDLDKKQAYERAVELLKMVGLPDAESRMKAYPHQLSGGQRQRVMIAIALACRPKLLIADEPTTALDVTVQAQILDLMRDLQREMGSSVLLVTHDLGVVAEMADQVVVMYAGKVVEQGNVVELFQSPKHPYTEGLLNSIPRLTTDKKERLKAIRGSVPSLLEMPKGCRFNNRCPYATDKCFQEEPPLMEVGPGRYSRCWFALEGFGDKNYAVEKGAEA